MGVNKGDGGGALKDNPQRRAVTVFWQKIPFPHPFSLSINMFSSPFSPFPSLNGDLTLSVFTGQPIFSHSFQCHSLSHTSTISACKFDPAKCMLSNTDPRLGSDFNAQIMMPGSMPPEAAHNYFYMAYILISLHPFIHPSIHLSHPGPGQATTAHTQHSL